VPVTILNERSVSKFNRTPRGTWLPIRPNLTQRIPVSQDDADALEYLRTELTTIKGTILYDQFFPTMFFSQRLSMERTFSPENSDTYAKLKRFTERYTLPPAKEETEYRDAKQEIAPVKTWAEETLAVIEKFANFDSVDFRTYLKAKSSHGESGESTSEDEKQWRISDLSSETLVAGAKGKPANARLTPNGMPELNGNVIGAGPPSGRTQTTNKFLFKNGFLGSLKRNNSKASNREFVSRGKAIIH